MVNLRHASAAHQLWRQLANINSMIGGRSMQIYAFPVAVYIAQHLRFMIRPSLRADADPVPAAGYGVTNGGMSHGSPLTVQSLHCPAPALSQLLGLDAASGAWLGFSLSGGLEMFTLHAQWTLWPQMVDIPPAVAVESTA